MQNDPFIFCKKAKSQVDFSLKKKTNSVGEA